MSQFRFNHVFLTLLCLSAICAFLIPVEYTNRLHGWLDGAFAPAAYPIRRLGQIITHRGLASFNNPAATLPADAQHAIDELKAQVASLTIQLAEYRRLYNDRDLIGNAEDYCIPVKVIGTDSSPLRDALTLSGTSADGLQEGMPVLYKNFVVGKITSVGSGGSQVRLITDSGFRINALFARFTGKDHKDYAVLRTDPPQLEGSGRGLMTITNLNYKQVEGVQPGDLVQLYDPDDWPTVVHGSFLGRVVKIEHHPKAQLFAQITVLPWTDLRRLNEVMVFTGKRRLPPEQPANLQVNRKATP